MENAFEFSLCTMSDKVESVTRFISGIVGSYH